MNIQQSFMLALKSLASSKMRSFLTMLGIIIGIAAVIILVSLMSSLTSDVVATFEDMGANLISVSISGRGGNRQVTPEDMEDLLLEHPDVLAHVSPTVQVSGTVKAEGQNLSMSCTGVSESYDEIKQLSLQLGQHISFVDVESRCKNCVIGTYLVKELFSGENPLGQTLYINGFPFTVVGVLEEMGTSTATSSDNILLIPYTTAQQIGRSMITSYNFSATSKDTISDAKTAIENYLLEKFGSDDYFNLTDQSEIISELNRLIGMMTAILVGIAGISLLVGGIGIMNIMLVSVTERIREIGIRKSLGATPWDILGQFVVEACVTSGIGGIIGILVGIGGAYVGSTLIGLGFTVSAKAVLIAFTVSAAIGIGFGYFPARKASRLNPIDALRYD